MATRFNRKAREWGEVKSGKERHNTWRDLLAGLTTTTPRPPPPPPLYHWTWIIPEIGLNFHLSLNYKCNLQLLHSFGRLVLKLLKWTRLVDGRLVVISLGIRSLEDFIKDPIVTAFINNLLHLFQLPFPVALLLLLALELVGLDPFKVQHLRMSTRTRWYLIISSGGIAIARQVWNSGICYHLKTPPPTPVDVSLLILLLNSAESHSVTQPTRQVVYCWELAYYAPGPFRTIISNYWLTDS